MLTPISFWAQSGFGPISSTNSIISQWGGVTGSTWSIPSMCHNLEIEQISDKKYLISWIDYSVANPRLMLSKYTFDKNDFTLDSQIVISSASSSATNPPDIGAGMIGKFNATYSLLSFVKPNTTGSSTGTAYHLLVNHSGALTYSQVGTNTDIQPISSSSSSFPPYSFGTRYVSNGALDDDRVIQSWWSTTTSTGREVARIVSINGPTVSFGSNLTISANNSRRGDNTYFQVLGKRADTGKYIVELSKPYKDATPANGFRGLKIYLTYNPTASSLGLTNITNGGNPLGGNAGSGLIVDSTYGTTIDDQGVVDAKVRHFSVTASQVGDYLFSNGGYRPMLANLSADSANWGTTVWYSTHFRLAAGDALTISDVYSYGRGNGQAPIMNASGTNRYQVYGSGQVGRITNILLKPASSPLATDALFMSVFGWNGGINSFTYSTTTRGDGTYSNSTPANIFSISGDPQYTGPSMSEPRGWNLPMDNAYYKGPSTFVLSKDDSDGHRIFFTDLNIASGENRGGRIYTVVLDENGRIKTWPAEE